MKRFFVINALAFLFLTLISTQAATAQRKGKTPKTKNAAPRTVEDFYMILPVKYFSYLEYEPKNRASLLGSVNISKGFLMFDNNRPIQLVNAEILLLKRMSGVSMLAISFTECLIDECPASLRFVEYENGRWTEVKAAPPFEREKVAEIYRRKTGKTIDAKTNIIFDISPDDKSISVRIVKLGATTEIYKLEWDGNIYDFALPNE